MVPQSSALRWLAGLAPAAMAGCNVIFGISGGQPLASSTATTSTTTGGTGGGGGTGGMVAFAVSPPAATLLARSTSTFTTTIPGATWKVVEPAGGAVTAQGAYTAPFDEGVYHLEAASVSHPLEKAEATVTVKRMVTPATIVSTGELATATGHGSQSHLAYAQGTGQWWLFHDPSGAAALATMRSDDFVIWHQGEQLALPQGHSGDGRDLSIAYRRLGAHDVVHVTQGSGSGQNLGRYHVRAVLSPDHLAFGTPQPINTGGSAPPDGSATVILPNGTVIDSTGYEPTPQTPPLSPCGSGDVDTYTSAVMDDGTTSFDAVAFGQQVLWCVANVVNARQLLAVGDAAVQLYVDGQSIPPTNVLMNVRTSGGGWTPAEPPPGPAVVPTGVFVAGQTFGVNDWTAAVKGGTAHAVRRLGQVFEHRIMSTPGTWADGGAITTEPTLLDSGLFLAPYGDGLVLVALSADAGSRVRYTAFDGAVWSAWTTLADAPATRSYLGGFAPESGAKPAVIWTQVAGTSFGISGAALP